MRLTTPQGKPWQRFLLSLGGLLFLALTAVLAIYLFVWVLIILVVAIPAGYLWLRHRLRRLRKEQSGMSDDPNIHIISQEKIF